jgi:hypothetical protein
MTILHQLQEMYRIRIGKSKDDDHLGMKGTVMVVSCDGLFRISQEHIED